MGVSGKWAPGARPAVLQVHAGPAARRAPGSLCEVRPAWGFSQFPSGTAFFLLRERKGGDDLGGVRIHLQMKLWKLLVRFILVIK